MDGQAEIEVCVCERERERETRSSADVVLARIYDVEMIEDAEMMYR
jgi:hypothetical protein